LEELKVVLTQTINAVEAITKDPLDTVLGTLTVPQLARLVAALITVRIVLLRARAVSH
jgi:hypothetical protein